MLVDSVKAVVEPSPAKVFLANVEELPPEPDALEAMVIESLLASVVRVILLPATKVSVSVVASATTSD